MYLKNKNYIIFSLIIALLSCMAVSAIAQNKTNKKQSIIINTDKRTDLQKLKGEPIPQKKEDDKVYLPGGRENIQYSPLQDSMYFNAMRNKMPSSTRFALELLASSKENAFVESMSNTEWSVAMKNLAMIPESAYKPLAVDVANYEAGIMRSFYVPGVPLSNKMGTMQIPLSTVGRLLGLSEDVTPVINYSVTSPSDVEILVYSMQAIVLQTMFKGYQSPGSYTLTWNQRDANGKLMPRGDYVIEARIGNKILRQKRVVIF